jgi:signal transduction histidine kinase
VSLSQRLSAVFALLLLACGGVSVWLQVNTSTRHAQETTQHLSLGLAEHIAGTAQLMDRAGWRPKAVRELFDHLMAVNPAVEVYLLSTDGQVVGNAVPEGGLRRRYVDLDPIQRLLAGDDLPILGDDPRSATASKVFSAAPVQVDEQAYGYVYVILHGAAWERLAAHVSSRSVLQSTLWAMGTTILLSLVMGLVAFHSITRPLRALTVEVQAVAADGNQVPERTTSADEMMLLRLAFHQLRQRIAEQWRQLTEQDQQRRDLLANISHDLRTPMTSLHGYLETLLLKEQSISVAQRRRYLEIALGQSRKVGRMAQELFELARLESGLVHADREPFALDDLIQDVVHKFELAAQARGHILAVDISAPLPAAVADLSMIERVLTNLLDNAIRHNPHGTHTTISVRPSSSPARLRVEVRDSGQGIPHDLREGLFTRIAVLRQLPCNPGGGFGLIVVQRMLQLNDSQIHLVDDDGRGSTFVFHLPVHNVM